MTTQLFPLSFTFGALLITLHILHKAGIKEGSGELSILPKTAEDLHRGCHHEYMSELSLSSTPTCSQRRIKDSNQVEHRWRKRSKGGFVGSGIYTSCLSCSPSLILNFKFCHTVGNINVFTTVPSSQIWSFPQVLLEKKTEPFNEVILHGT